jgi:GNAT superfamily N-acetyltransferase
MISIRRLEPTEWRAYRELRLRGLADAPDAFGSTLAAESEKPDEHWIERLTTGGAPPWNLPLVADSGDELVGLVWGRIDPAATRTANIFQMWVAPERRGQGLGARLVDAVVTWARESRAREVVLRVTCGDSPALRLYARAGFVPEGDPEFLRPGARMLAQPMRLAL